MNGMNMGAQQHESNVIHIENAKHEGIKTPEMICEQVESVVSDFVKKTNKDFFVIAAIKNNNISVELFKKKYDGARPDSEGEFWGSLGPEKRVRSGAIWDSPFIE